MVGTVTSCHLVCPFSRGQQIREMLACHLVASSLQELSRVLRGRGRCAQKQDQGLSPGLQLREGLPTGTTSRVASRS